MNVRVVRRSKRTEFRKNKDYYIGCNTCSNRLNHTISIKAGFLCQNYLMFPLVLCTPPALYDAVNCFIFGRRRVAVARYRTICLVLGN